MSSQRPEISKLVSEHASSGHSPSGMVAVARGGAVEEFYDWGRDGYRPDTPFRVASCTKSFTALALLALRRAGRLTLDDEASDHLPELRFVADEGWPAVRVRHLLGMSSGLATDNPWGDRQESISDETLTAFAKSGPRLVFPPGSSYEYSNLGYALLGRIVERASGRPYREFVRAEIIDPLGLIGTRFSATELASSVATYHRTPMLPGRPGGWSTQAQTGPGAFSPIGGLYSTAEDLAVWADLHVRMQPPAGATYGAADLLEGQQPLTRIASGPAEAPLHGNVVSSYGYGLRVEEYEHHGTVVSHSGGYPGLTAYMCWHQETGVAVIASSNGTHSGAPPLARRVLAELIRHEPAKPPRLAPWPETVTAVEQLDGLVRSAASAGPDAAAAGSAELFAENVELDFPVRSRALRLAEALASLGGARAPQGALEALHERPSRARWSVPCELGRLELYLELMPVAPYLVQTFSAVAVSGRQRVTLF